MKSFLQFNGSDVLQCEFEWIKQGAMTVAKMK